MYSRLDRCYVNIDDASEAVWHYSCYAHTTPRLGHRNLSDHRPISLSVCRNSSSIHSIPRWICAHPSFSRNVLLLTTHMSPSYRNFYDLITPLIVCHFENTSPVSDLIFCGVVAISRRKTFRMPLRTLNRNIPSRLRFWRFLRIGIHRKYEFLVLILDKFLLPPKIFSRR